jgi:hypothetical protein
MLVFIQFNSKMHGPYKIKFEKKGVTMISKTTSPHYRTTATGYILLHRNLQKRECHNYHVRFYTTSAENKTCIIHSLLYDRSIAPSKTSSPQSAI